MNKFIKNIRLSILDLKFQHYNALMRSCHEQAERAAENGYYTDADRYYNAGVRYGDKATKILTQIDVIIEKSEGA